MTRSPQRGFVCIHLQILPRQERNILKIRKVRPHPRDQITSVSRLSKVQWQSPRRLKLSPRASDSAVLFNEVTLDISRRATPPNRLLPIPGIMK